MSGSNEGTLAEKIMILAPFAFAKAEVMTQDVPIEVCLRERIGILISGITHVEKHGHSDWFSPVWHVLPTLMFVENFREVGAAAPERVFPWVEKECLAECGVHLDQCTRGDEISIDRCGFYGK